MAGLASLSALKSAVTVRGQLVDVYPLKLSDIAGLLAKHKTLADAFNDGADIVTIITRSGTAAVADFIAAATREPIQNVLQAGLTGVEEGRILLETIQITLPENDEEMQDFIISLLAVLGRAGDKIGQTSSKS